MLLFAQLMPKMQMNKSISVINSHYRNKLYWCLLTLFLLTAITLTPIQALLNLFHDDSFFYMVIARNYAAGLGYSFDGLNITNGFHPLWLWLLSGISSQITLIGESGIRMVVVTQSLLSIVAALLYVRLLARGGALIGVQLSFFFSYLFICTFADMGQESALFSCLFAFLLTLLIGPITTQSNIVALIHLVAITTIPALMVLARLDCIFLLVGSSVALFLSNRKKQALLVALGIACGLISIFSFNLLFFGHPYSISAWLKSGFDWSKAWQILIPGIGIRVGLVYLLLISAFWNMRLFYGLNRQPAARPRMPFVPVFLLCICTVYSFYFLVLFWGVNAIGSWYFNQALGLSLFIYALSTTYSSESQRPLGFSFTLTAETARKIIYLPLFLVLVIGVLLFGLKLGWTHSSEASKEMGQWIAENIDLQAVIFQRDGAGASSYFSKHSIINGDGLVNNMQYQQMLRSAKLCQYLKDQKVQYLVTNTFINSSGQIQDYIYLWTKGLPSIALTKVSPAKALYETKALPTYRIFNLADATVCS